MTQAPIRLAELMAALSLATDLGMGQPVEFAWQACVAAMRLGEALKFSEAELRGVYYQSLLRYIGCNADTRLLAAVFGDELALRADLIHADSSGPEFLAMSLRAIRAAQAGASPLRLAAAPAGRHGGRAGADDSSLPGVLWRALVVRGRAMVRLIEAAEVLLTFATTPNERVTYGLARDLARQALRALVVELPADLTGQILIASEGALGPAGDVGKN